MGGGQQRSEKVLDAEMQCLLSSTASMPVQCAAARHEMHAPMRILARETKGRCILAILRCKPADWHATPVRIAVAGAGTECAARQRKRAWKSNDKAARRQCLALEPEPVRRRHPEGCRRRSSSRLAWVGQDERPAKLSGLRRVLRQQGGLLRRVLHRAGTR